MADGLQLNAGADGGLLVTALLTWSGQTMHLQGEFPGILSGSEGSWSYDVCPGGAGAVTAGTPRMTLASDDPAVALLATIDADTGNIATSLSSIDGKITACNTGAVVLAASDGTDIGDVDIASVPAPLNVTGGGTEAAALRVTLANDSTGVVSVDDGGGALTVDGTVTANAGTNLNTSALALESGGNLDTIAGDTTSIDGKITACNTGAVVVSSGTITTVSAVTAIANALPAGDNNIGNVDVVTLPIDFNAGAVGATTPRVTLASDDPAVAHLATIAGDTTSLDGKVTACNTGDVTIGAALPAGTNAIGKLAANSGVDIGDVDVTSIVPGTAATNLGKAEDAAHSSGDTGVMPLAVRNDDLAALAGTDGDYAPLQVDAEGALFVNPAAAEPKRDSGVAAGGAPGADTLIAAPGASIKIRVLALGLFATSATTNNVYIDNEDNDLLFNSGNPLPLSLDADGDTVAGFVLPYNPGGWFETDAANEAVTLNTSAAQDIAWSITWIEVPG